MNSDGKVLAYGTIDTRSGCLLTGNEVLTALEARESERREAEKAKQAKAARDASL